jgi:transcriptional regulator with XRE-family HTH domain
MENKKLNIHAIQAKMEELGLNQSAIADKIDYSREIVSNWLKGEKFPRPKALLELSQLLNLKFDQIVISHQLSEPVIAFRKKANVKTTNDVYHRAKDMGMMLKCLVPYLPYPKLSRPSSFINPNLDYYYIQAAAKEIRDFLKIKEIKIDFNSLINIFAEMHTTIIPVMWGERDKHENALHIYLPDTMTTWVYLNLDVNIVDFKFWILHELGHVKTPDLQGNDAEDFADAFAGALLFPDFCARDAYKTIMNISDDGIKINEIKRIAKELVISPLTIYYEINNYANAVNLQPLKFNIHPATTNFCKNSQTVSSILFDNMKPSAERYIQIVETQYKTVIFNAISDYARNERLTSGFIQRILDVPLPDAEEIFRYIMHVTV